MNKWERLNSELADARHYAADMKERAEQAERERDELRTKLDAVPVKAMGEMMDAFENEGFPFGYKLQRDAIMSWLDAQVQP